MSDERSVRAEPDTGLRDKVRAMDASVWSGRSFSPSTTTLAGDLLALMPTMDGGTNVVPTEWTKSIGPTAISCSS